LKREAKNGFIFPFLKVATAVDGFPGMKQVAWIKRDLQGLSILTE
jgi:hypothetical protein